MWIISLEIALVLTENENPAPTTTVDGATLRASTTPFATKLATWNALRDALVPFGCTEQWTTDSATAIVDDAEAAGDMAMAASLRAQVTAAQIALAKDSDFIYLWSQRVDDIEAVFGAYDARLVTRMSVYDCELRIVPSSLARFTKLTRLSISEPRVDSAGLRGLALPSLELLNLCDTGVRELRRDDVAGFPLLAKLYLCRCPLVDLDPAIIEVCPKLERVVIDDTPLGADAAKMAVLRARWRGVVWEPEPSFW